eukprot:SAG11_NODE_3002_length_2776_cov_1.699290_2_plen_106_part_00
MPVGRHSAGGEALGRARREGRPGLSLPIAPGRPGQIDAGQFKINPHLAKIQEPGAPDSREAFMLSCLSLFGGFLLFVVLLVRTSNGLWRAMSEPCSECRRAYRGA